MKKVLYLSILALLLACAIMWGYLITTEELEGSESYWVLGVYCLVFLLYVSQWRHVFILNQPE